MLHETDSDTDPGSKKSREIYRITVQNYKNIIFMDIGYSIILYYNYIESGSKTGSGFGAEPVIS